MTKQGLTFKYLKNDLPAGLVVFLVAVPLCLGIALASGAPLFAGIITGIIGGIVVGALNKSELSVSGPAAGLTVIVLTAITNLGGYEAFLLAVFIAGILQFIFGVVKAGIIGNFFPSSVIRGMLAAIGLIIILGQLPVFLGIDKAGLEETGKGLAATIFSGDFDTLSALMNPVTLVIGVVSLLIMIGWEKAPFSKTGAFRFIPSALVAVVFALLANLVIAKILPASTLSESYLVQVPYLFEGNAFETAFIFPDFSQWNNPEIYITAITIAVIASLETLLSVEAVDRLDPMKRKSDRNQVLLTQGIGNSLCGLVGGLPMTAVIVRSSTNVGAGGKTRMASVIHGLFLVLAVLVLPGIMNLIPLSALAAVLLMVGYKLTKPVLYRAQAKLGREQFIPFIITIGAILVTDLLVGILVGVGVSVYFVLMKNYKLSHSLDKNAEKIELNGNRKEKTADKPVVNIRLSEHVSFLGKPLLLNSLEQVPPESKVVIDGSQLKFIDHDVLETIDDFIKNKADERKIELELNKVPHIKNGTPA